MFFRRWRAKRREAIAQQWMAEQTRLDPVSIPTLEIDPIALENWQQAKATARAAADPAASRLHIYKDDRHKLSTFQTQVLLHANVVQHFGPAYSQCNGRFETGESDASMVPFPPRRCIERRSFSADDRMPVRHVHTTR